MMIKSLYINLGTTTEIWAEAFGCKVFYPENNNPMAIHMVDNAKEAEKISIPDIENTRLWDILENSQSFTSGTWTASTLRIA